MYHLDETPLIKEKILENLRSRILVLRSGTSVRIPSERTLSEQLGASRLSVRAALKVLVSEGLLVQIQGKGTYITPITGLSNISLICSPDIKPSDPFYSNFLAELTAEAARRAINLTMADTMNPLQEQTGTPAIIAGLLPHSQLHSVLSAYKPVIAVQEHPWFADITQISFDDYRIGCDAAKILYEHNHKNILHLAGPEKYPSAFYRRKGVQDAAEHLGIHVETVTDKMNWAGGYSQGEAFLSRQSHPEHPTAVFAANDWMAAGFMKRLQEAGVRIPDEISVLGCDNIPLSNEYSPALSTFDLNIKSLIREIFKTIEETMLFPGKDTIIASPASQSFDIAENKEAAIKEQKKQSTQNSGSKQNLPDERNTSGGKRIMLPATLVLRASIQNNSIKDRSETK